MINVPSQLGKKFVRPYLENTHHKRTGEMVQVVEYHLPGKSEALCSSHSGGKKKSFFFFSLIKNDLLGW
jgi:hypothetical protein